VAFEEGDAIRIRCLRQGDAKRQAKLHAEQGGQCDEAIEALYR
jgi:hypothetical protein